MEITFIKSFRGRLVSMFLALSLLPIVVVGYISYSSSQSMIEEQFLNSLTTAAESREAAIVHYLRGKEGRTLDFSADRTTSDLLERMIGKSSGSVALTEKLNTHLAREMKPLDAEVYETFVLNLEGKVVASTNKEAVGKDKSTDPYFVGGRKGTYFKDVYHSTSTNQNGFAVSAPVRSKTSGNMIGVLINRYNLSTLNEIVMNREGLGATGEVYIVNRDGYMITESRSVEGAILSQRVDTEPVRLFQGERKTMTGVYTDYTGRPVVGASMGDDIDDEFGLGWTIVAEIDTKEAFAPAVGLRNFIGLICLVSIIVIVLIILATSNKLMMPITQLSLTARQVDSASAEISSASQQQSAAAQEQSAAISETTTASTELAKSSEQTEENIKRVMEVTNHAMAGMSEIKDMVGGTETNIKSLNEKSQKIGKITELIKDVADQTNLLAVNAAIEAARAGEQGRGFTVVADEIRKLADSTAKSTKGITALIEEIQHEVQNATLSMERSISSVDEEVQLSRESVERAKEIELSVRQQVSGSKQIATAMKDIDEAMKQVSGGAKQNKVTAEQLNSMAGDLKTVIEKLNISTDNIEN